MVFNKAKIIFTRGDDDAMMVALGDGTFQTGDKVYFSLKQEPSDTTDIFQIESDNFVEYGGVANAAVLINIPHERTINLELGIYYYDILVEWANGTYVTVVRPTKFTLVAGGSHGEPI